MGKKELLMRGAVDEDHTRLITNTQSNDDGQFLLRGVALDYKKVNWCCCSAQPPIGLSQQQQQQLLFLIFGRLFPPWSRLFFFFFFLLRD
jgi:hypothetical protein